MTSAASSHLAETNSNASHELDIVHVVRQFKPMVGGLEDVVFNLAKHQLDRFRSVRVVTLDRLFNAPDKKLPEHEVIEGIEVTRIPFSGSKRYPLAPRVFQAIGGAHLVHVHAIDFFFDALALGRWVHGRPLVATTHGGFFHTQKYAALKKIWFNSLTRLSVSQYNGIACCGESDFALFRPLAPAKCQLIENGVDLKKYGNAASEISVKRLVTVGRFSVNKRLDRVLNAVKALRAQDANWQLDIVGSPSDLSVNDLKKLISERGLSGNVQVHTGLTDLQVRGVFKNASLYLSASEYEGFGLVLIEALSAGLLPIVQANDAFQSLAKHHTTVYLTDFADTEGAALAISSAFDRLQKRPELRDAGMNSAKRHGWETVSTQYEEFYRTALGSTE